VKDRTQRRVYESATFTCIDVSEMIVGAQAKETYVEELEFPEYKIPVETDEMIRAPITIIGIVSDMSPAPSRD